MFQSLVPGRGFEPPCPYGRYHLKVVRLASFATRAYYAFPTYHTYHTQYFLNFQMHIIKRSLNYVQIKNYVKIAPTNERLEN